jgi:hypothetical protein
MPERPDLALVVDASVGLKWVLQEADSPLAMALADSDEVLLVPDFWLTSLQRLVAASAKEGDDTG